jgi:hypothetical protein
MVFERDQTLRLRDGTKIYADIYRPTNETVVPAIMVWGPYGKSGSGGFESGFIARAYMLTLRLQTGHLNLGSFPLRVGVAESRLSGYENFEG